MVGTQTVMLHVLIAIDITLLTISLLVTVSTLQDSDSDSVTSQEDLGDNEEATSKEDTLVVVGLDSISTHLFNSYMFSMMRS